MPSEHTRLQRNNNRHFLNKTPRVSIAINLIFILPEEKLLTVFILLISFDPFRSIKLRSLHLRIFEERIIALKFNSLLCYTRVIDNFNNI
jgi:hypothetical protein